MTQTAQRTVLETILAWSEDRPAWQRDALRRVVANGRLDEAGLKEVIAFCKLGDTTNGASPAPEPFERGHLPASPGQDEPVTLESISDVAGANLLAGGQTLRFEPKGLTVIYGDNGAGKSGYARILKRACRARHAGKIEPNAYADAAAVTRATATIAYSIGQAKEPDLKWQDSDSPHPTLSAISVFDSDCASVHITEKNEVAFRPFGVDIPDELATVCQSVKDALTREKKLLEESRNPFFAKPTWRAHTAVGRLLGSLQHDLDLTKLAQLATFTDADQQQLTRLKDDLSKDPAKAAAEELLLADNIATLAAAVSAIGEKTVDSALQNVWTLHRAARQERGAAKLAAQKAFSNEPLEGIGGELWRKLWDSARKYSSKVAYPAHEFPASHEDARCVLCQQRLDSSAIQRMTGFEEFIQNDMERKAQDAERVAKNALDALVLVSIKGRSFRSSVRQVEMHDPVLAKAVRRFLASARLRRAVVLNAVDSDQAPTLPSAMPNPGAALSQLELAARGHAADLRKATGTEERTKLEVQAEELEDRALLTISSAVVEAEVERLRSIRALDERLVETATNSITKLGNDIADTVITPKLRDRFQEEIVKLAAEKVRVEIVRSGGKQGSPQYQVRLFAKPSAKVHQILSEGEQTCVALAAFLTELATASHRSALVFDDPVSSLDHRWRASVAKRLIEEAKTRQIIVFTHDLIFVNDLDDLAEKEKVPALFATVGRGAAGAGVVGPGLPWKGMSVEDRIDKLEKAARSAKSLYDANVDDEYGKEAVGIYNNLRASWERALEDIVFARVIRRHRDYIDTKNLKKVTALTPADADGFLKGIGKCHGIVDAHDPSSGRNAVAPPPAELLQDIQTLKDWASSMRDRQKNIA